MSSIAATPLGTERPPTGRPISTAKPGPVTLIVFVGLLAIGLLLTAYSLARTSAPPAAGSRPGCPTSCSAWRC